MGTLSTSAIIVIVIVACLALVSLGAALFKTYGVGPGEKERPYNFSREQESYMRSVRLKNLGFFQRESMMGYPGGGGGGSGKGLAPPVVRDVESGYSENESSHY
ncbi:uncharacterized protein BO97DRAFT_160273 [Aspergillus homomorphus CBS 101889]|uniref:Uncharacterized protein n=1 Tax=Aspergillus homomorphus (strain CBS 101889) TaxID=1450537 RepID=A0A395HQR6_ASPHC|nr:hypothetical protein BO97DRAFT_160273 [Aspergillus homomorphus CBS 101889]RAL09773.1 hypothetical protein BO97DRAFT_160273 [Aspergillus homomorphus CBS 101889]